MLRENKGCVLYEEKTGVCGFHTGQRSQKLFKHKETTKPREGTSRRRGSQMLTSINKNVREHEDKGIAQISESKDSLSPAHMRLQVVLKEFSRKHKILLMDISMITMALIC